MRWQHMSNYLLALPRQVFAFLSIIRFVCNAEGWCAGRYSGLHPTLRFFVRSNHLSRSLTLCSRPGQVAVRKRSPSTCAVIRSPLLQRESLIFSSFSNTFWPMKAVLSLIVLILLATG